MHKVKFIGCSKDQHRWGDHTGNPDQLTIGEVYEVSKMEEHSWHTKLYLKGIDGSFNSVCFDEVKS